jgi:cell division protein FtsI/penicillin-binding protein 2
VSERTPISTRAQLRARVCDPGVVRRLGVVAVVVAAVVAVVAFVALRDNGGGDDPAAIPGATPTVQQYLTAWDQRDYAAMADLAYQPPASFAFDHQGMFDALHVASARYTAGRVQANADRTGANATFTATLQLRGFGRWTYQGRMSLVRVVTTANGTRTLAEPGDGGGRWLVNWQPSTMHPQMRVGLTFARTRTWPARASILDGQGRVLVGAGEVVQIGVEPRDITDRAQVAKALQEQLGFSPAELDREIARAQPDWFVPVGSPLPRGPHYDSVRAVLYPIPGIKFQTTKQRVHPDDTFARNVLGRTHEITAEELKEMGILYDVGDIVGAGGVEETYQKRLGGRPTGDVHLVDTKTKETVAVLHRFAGTPPRPVALTLDPTVQAAADAALTGVTQPAALVAVDTQTGEVRAVSSRPITGFNRALTGRYPPGSTFKIVTSTAALSTGSNAATSITCPAELSIGGRKLHNFEGEATGSITFERAFEESCNNAFVQLAERAGTPAMEAAAASFGFNANYSSGLPSFGGSYPHPKDVVELAESSIGQAHVEASPLHMASVAAAAATGTWRPPVIVRGTANDVKVAPVPAAVLPTLQAFMAAVVQRGTGTAAAVPGKQVFGKTGTAQYDERDPNATHAWFVGYSGNIAFAVLVEGGGVGGRVAAPIANRFVAALP